MIVLSAGQLLQIAFAVSASAIAVIAGVFLLVLRGTRRRRGMAWFWGWAFLALVFALLAVGQAFPAFEHWFSPAAVCCAIVTSIAGVAGAYSFRGRGRMPAWTIAVLAAAALAALLIGWWTDRPGDLVAAELPLAVSVALQALVLMPVARTARMPGLQTACLAQVVLLVMLCRTLAGASILALRGEALTDAYWAVETGGGIILAFVLAMGELIALLDEVRVELEDGNAALNQALEGLEVAAKIDPLTGLYNRFAFYTLVSELAERDTLSGSIAIVDLNQLKRINDTFGHHAGDRALLNVAMRLQEVVRQSDYVFRWGGDEFVVLLPDMPVDAARERLAEIPPPAAVEVPEHAPVPLAVSWGLAPLQRDVDAALREADAQLYAQKRLFAGTPSEVPKS